MKYLNHLTTHQLNYVLTLFDDIQYLTKKYINKRSNNIKSIDYEFFHLQTVYQKIYQLKGYMLGIGLNFKNKIIYNNDCKLEQIVFWNNSSRSVKYSIGINWSKLLFTVKKISQPVSPNKY